MEDGLSGYQVRSINMKPKCPGANVITNGFVMLKAIKLEISPNNKISTIFFI